MHSDEELTVWQPPQPDKTPEQDPPQPVQHELVLQARDSHDSYPLAEEMLVGREVECAISLESKHISRYHAKITVSGHSTVVEDLESSNGTYVNGQRITQKTPITVGDDIAFHKIRFRIVSSFSGDADATIIAPSAHSIKPRPVVASSSAQHQALYTSLPLKQTSEPPPVETPGDQVPEATAEHTQMLSSTQLQRLAIRSQQAKKDVKAGSGARLIIMTAPLRGKVFNLETAAAEHAWRIGRDQHADLCLKDKTISFQHVQVNKTADGYELVTLSAKNGMMINGRATNHALLKHNDKIQLGRMELVFKDSVDFAEDNSQAEAVNLKKKLFRTRCLIIGTVTLLSALLVLAGASFMTS